MYSLSLSNFLEREVLGVSSPSTTHAPSSSVCAGGDLIDTWFQRRCSMIRARRSWWTPHHRRLHVLGSLWPPCGLIFMRQLGLRKQSTQPSSSTQPSDRKMTWKNLLADPSYGTSSGSFLSSSVYSWICNNSKDFIEFDEASLLA